MRQVFPTSPWLLLGLQADVMSYLQVWKQPLNAGALPPLFPSQASMLWSPLPPRALAVPPAFGKTHGPAAPARSRNHVSCHYLHYLDWEQSVMSPSIIVSLPGDAEKGGEEQEL